MTPNVLICGKTGTGKSSLINFIFNKKVAEEGIAEPKTKDFILYISKGINFFDSEGYEIGNEKKNVFKKKLFKFFEEKNKGQLSERLHIVWYCVSASGKRIEESDNQYLNMIKNKGLPVCVLITKIDEVSEDGLCKLKQDIQQKQMDIEIFNMTRKKDCEGYIELNELLFWTYYKKNVVENAFNASASMKAEKSAVNEVDSWVKLYASKKRDRINEVDYALLKKYRINEVDYELIKEIVNQKWNSHGLVYKFMKLLLNILLLPLYFVFFIYYVFRLFVGREKGKNS